MAPLIENIDNVPQNLISKIQKIFEQALNQHIQEHFRPTHEIPLPIECSVSFVFRINKNRLQALVSNRTHKIEPKSKKGFQIQVSGGKHEQYEDPHISALRELSEEVGISIEELLPKAFAGESPFPAGVNQEFFCWPFFFFIKDETIESYEAKEKDKTGEWYWFDFIELYKCALADDPNIFAMYEGFSFFGTRPIENIIEYIKNLNLDITVTNQIIQEVLAAIPAEFLEPNKES